MISGYSGNSGRGPASKESIDFFWYFCGIENVRKEIETVGTRNKAGKRGTSMPC